MNYADAPLGVRWVYAQPPEQIGVRAACERTADGRDGRAELPGGTPDAGEPATRVTMRCRYRLWGTGSEGRAESISPVADIR